MPSYRLTRRAGSDLLDAFLFGLERFGEAQAQRYQLGFERCFEMLAENPGLGRPADILSAGLRRHEHASHVVLYEPDAEGVLIVTVVHARSIRALDL